MSGAQYKTVSKDQAAYFRQYCEIFALVRILNMELHQRHHLKVANESQLMIRVCHQSPTYAGNTSRQSCDLHEKSKVGLKSGLITEYLSVYSCYSTRKTACNMIEEGKEPQIETKLLPGDTKAKIRK
jgi:hypothetical protein